MTRPGFVLDVDERTPALLVPDGDRLRYERFPLGTRVLYAPESSPALIDPAGAIGAALAMPVDGDPLAALLRPGMALTVVVDDGSGPVPPMPGIDIRARIAEQVLTLAAAAGVDDVVVLIANGLRRRPTTPELQRLLGERIHPSFAPSGALQCHDASAPDLAPIDAPEQGDEVLVNARAASSDLVVFVTVVQDVGDEARAVVPVGLGAATDLVQPERVTTLAAAMAASLPLFTIAATVDNAWFGGRYAFGNKREWEYSMRDRAAAAAAVRASRITPKRYRQAAAGGSISGSAVTGIFAGRPGALGARVAATVSAAQSVAVTGQSDVLVAGVPAVAAGPGDSGSTSNPVLAAGWALDHLFGSFRGSPVVRPDGALILYHPLEPGFGKLEHPSYVDFYDEVLAVSTDPVVVAEKFQDRFAEDPWYLHLYRTSHACHGLAPFATWNATAAALAHCGPVVWVGANRAVAARLGFRAASTLADALEIVAPSVGGAPSITFAHTPPRLIADLTADPT